MSDKQNDLNDPFLQKVKEQLDNSVEHIDGETLSRLKQARAKALTAKVSRPWFAQPVCGGMATASVAIVVAVMWLDGGSPQIASGIEDIDLLTSAESIELYEEYEFYQWLDDEDLAS